MPGLRLFAKTFISWIQVDSSVMGIFGQSGVLVLNCLFPSVFPAIPFSSLSLSSQHHTLGCLVYMITSIDVVLTWVHTADPENLSSVEVEVLGVALVVG